VFIETNWYDFYDAANDQVRTEYMDDRLHPNTDGYYMMAENIFEGIGALFDPQVTMDNPYVHRMSGYGGWHLVSAIGDDLTEAMYMQDVLRERLGHPLGFSSPATESKLSAHGMSGSYIGNIQDQVISQNWGDGEGAEYVLVMAGLNDMVWGQQNGADPAGHAAEVVSQVQGIINEASGGDPNNPNRPRVIVSALPPSQDAGLNQHIQAYNQALASSLIGADLFIETNWYDIVDGQSGLAQGGLMTDFMLPNGDGYYRIAENWFEALGALRDPGIADNNPYIHRQSSYRQIN
jgi:lysophospholipase L1-like esterase